MWENYLDIGYGSIRQGKNASWLKTDDKIDFTSKFGKKVVPHWYYAALVNFKTQMTPGFNYPNDSTKISDLLAPAYFLGAIGMDLKPSKNFTAYIAPLTAKVTVVNDQNLADAGAFGVEKATYDDQGNILTEGLNARAEFGGYVRFFGKREIMKNVSLNICKIYISYFCYILNPIKHFYLFRMRVTPTTNPWTLITWTWVTTST